VIHYYSRQRRRRFRIKDDPRSVLKDPKEGHSSVDSVALSAEVRFKDSTSGCTCSLRSACALLLLTFETSRPPRLGVGLPLVIRERRPSSARYFISRRPPSLLSKKIIERATSAQCPRTFYQPPSHTRALKDAPRFRPRRKRERKRETLARDMCQGHRVI